jgi:hypothetical protein
VNLHVLHGTCEYVKSYEGEGAMVVAAIRANEFTAHEADVGFEWKVFGSLPVDGVRAHTSNGGPSDEAVEIGNGAGLNTRGRQKYVEERSTRTEQLEAARNWERCGRGCAVVPMTLEYGCGVRHFRQQSGGSKRSHREAALFEEASTAQQSLCEMAMTWKCLASGDAGS